MEHFNVFKAAFDRDLIPHQFSFSPQPLCLLAIDHLQKYLETQTDWEHNFGLGTNEKGRVIGKMFGVLVVETPDKQMGYLAAFSGKLSNRNLFTRFVPPVYDALEENGFLSKGMEVLSNLSASIKEIPQNGLESQLQSLKRKRKAYSISLQHQLFESYHFLNQAGEEKSLIELFKAAGHKNPPAGAGECAAPKLLNYAFRHRLRPLALSEFWWGQSPKSATWKHKQLYAPCKEKCGPILAHMLKGI